MSRAPITCQTPRLCSRVSRNRLDSVDGSGAPMKQTETHTHPSLPQLRSSNTYLSSAFYLPKPVRFTCSFRLRFCMALRAYWRRVSNSNIECIRIIYVSEVETGKSNISGALEWRQKVQSMRLDCRHLAAPCILHGFSRQRVPTAEKMRPVQAPRGKPQLWELLKQATE